MGKCVIKELKRRISDDRGATMVFALVVFLIAAMMSMIIVNAAIGNIARLRRQYEKRQMMLAITSAESLVENMIHGMSARKDTKTGNWKMSFNKSDYFKGESGKQLAEKLEGLMNSSGSTTLHITSSMSSSNQPGQMGQTDPLAVEVELSCDTSAQGAYAIKAKIRGASEGGGGTTGSTGNTGSTQDDNSTSKTFSFPAISIEISKDFDSDDDEGERAETGNPNFIQW